MSRRRHRKRTRFRSGNPEVNSDNWIIRRPLGIFLGLFILALCARALIQAEPIQQIHVIWAAAFALVMTVFEEFRSK